MEKKKNLWAIPTDKPSRLKQNKITKKISLVNKGIDLTSYTPINIYITSDEEITGFENNIWVIKGDRIFLWQNTMALVSNNKPKKIILTTDQDLIKDGIQAIPDEFIEWFVHNPSCEYVEVELIDIYFLFNKELTKSDEIIKKYKIIIPKEEIINCEHCGGDGIYITADSERVECPMCEKGKIPKEEPKQETLEDHVYIFDGAKWKQERMYSEEEVILLIAEAICKFKLGKLHDEEQIIESLLQFKKK